MTVPISVLGRIGVVIVTYRSAGEIQDCLGALPLDDLADVLVVDNDSPDDTVDVVRRLGLPRVRVIQRENDGFGAGCNAGMSSLLPQAELVLFLNPDARIEADDLTRLGDCLDLNPACALVGPQLTNGGAPQHSAGCHPTLATEVRPLLPRVLGRALPERRHAPDPAVAGPVGYVEGACLLGRLTALRSVGGFDATYFLCFEEMDLARRVAAAGWTVALCPAARAEHIGGASRQQVPEHGVEHKVRGQVLYLRTWQGKTAATVYGLLARGSWWLRRRTGRLSAPAYDAMMLALRTPLGRRPEQVTRKAAPP